MQRSWLLAPVDAIHKTKRSVEPLAEQRQPNNRAARNQYIALRLPDFVESVYFSHIETKRKPSTVRGYKQMWNRYLKPRSATWLMHEVETRTIQGVLDSISSQDKLSPQTMAHVKHLLGGIFHFAIAQGYLPRGTVNPVTFAETQAVQDFDGRAYTLEEVALMLVTLPEPSRTVVALAAFTGLREGEIRGLNWEAYTPRDPDDEQSLGVIRVLQSVWRGRIGQPKNSRSKAPVPLIPQLEAILDRHREACGNPASGPIFANSAGKALDLDSLYQREMKERLKAAGIDWEGWHGFRRGLATNLERIS